MPGGRKTQHRREAALAALLTERTLAAAAAKAGLAERTLKGWLAEPTFAAAYAGARQEVLRGTVVALAVASGKAVDTLVALLEDHNPHARARAAVALLTLHLRCTEVLDLAGQVEELRQQLEGVERHGRRCPAARNGEGGL
jgi:hypothetical protein